jgi:hypothetical protein
LLQTSRGWPAGVLSLPLRVICRFALELSEFQQSYGVGSTDGMHLQVVRHATRDGTLDLSGMLKLALGLIECAAKGNDNGEQFCAQVCCAFHTGP